MNIQNKHNLNQLELINQYGKRIAELNITGAFPEGYYSITEIIKCQIHSYWTELIVAANWHPIDYTNNEFSYPIVIPFNNLFLKESVGPKEMDPRKLIGATIKVIQVEKFETEYNGEIKSKLKAKWELIGYKEFHMQAAVAL